MPPTISPSSLADQLIDQLERDIAELETWRRSKAFARAPLEVRFAAMCRLEDLSARLARLQEEATHP